MLSPLRRVSECPSRSKLFHLSGWLVFSSPSPFLRLIPLPLFCQGLSPQPTCPPFSTSPRHRRGETPAHDDSPDKAPPSSLLGLQRQRASRPMTIFGSPCRGPAPVPSLPPRNFPPVLVPFLLPCRLFLCAPSNRTQQLSVFLPIPFPHAFFFPNVSPVLSLPLFLFPAFLPLSLSLDDVSVLPDRLCPCSLRPPGVGPASLQTGALGSFPAAGTWSWRRILWLSQRVFSFERSPRT